MEPRISSLGETADERAGIVASWTAIRESLRLIRAAPDDRHPHIPPEKREPTPKPAAG